mgnify:CR=1 FL=1
MPRYLKISLKVLAVIIGIIALLWVGIIAFVHYNKDKFAGIITRQINDRISGTITIGEIEPTIVKGFPDISFELKNVTLKDSLWHLHHTDVLNLERAYVSISLSSILDKTAYIKKLVLENGNITLYTDENEISNTHIFKAKEKTGNKEVDNPVNEIAINNVILTIKHMVKRKHFVLDIKKCDLLMDFNDTGWSANMLSDVDINSFAFNFDVGSFLKDKHLETDIQLRFNDSLKVITIPMQTLELDNLPYRFGGILSFTDTPAWFNLDVQAVDVPYKEIQEMLTPKISSKLKEINLTTVDSVSVKIIGKMQYRDTPYVKAAFVVKDKTLTIPYGEITRCSFKGFFLDEVVKGRGHGDENSMVYIEQLTGNYYGIDFKAKDASVTDLKNPLLKVHVTSNLALQKLNELIGVRSFRFNKGNASVNLKCQLGIKEESKIPPVVNGTVKFSGASFTYVPRKLNFTNAGGSVVFKGADLFLQSMQLQSEKNKVALSGSIKNLLNLYYTAPEKVVIACSLSSSKIDLGEYTTFLAERTMGPDEKINNATPKLGNFARQLDAVMESSVARIGLKITELDYKKFRADNIKAGITLTRSEIRLSDVHLNHAGGTMLLDGAVKPGKQSASFTANVDLDKINVRKLFYSFGNFGQTAILEENIKGIVSAQVTAAGGILSSGNLVPRSLNGKVQFTLVDGKLIDFEPLGTIGKLIFFNRDLNNITVEPLSGVLDVADSKITIQPLLVKTSAFNIFTEGVYGIPTGTNILVQVPLRNPKKDLNKSNKEMAETDLKKGIVINLHATDNNTGKVKIKLGKGNR